MKKLDKFIFESKDLLSPVIEDGKVKVLVLVSDEYVDDNLGLMRGKNRVCVIWSASDYRGYMRANGGTRWDDGRDWRKLDEVKKLLGNPDLKEVDNVKLFYSYVGTIGEPHYYNIKVYSGEVSEEDMDKFYKLDKKSLLIYKDNPSTASLSACFKKWRKEGWLSE